MNKNSKIYIAGHTGLVGSALTIALKEQGYIQTVLFAREYRELARMEKLCDLFCSVSSICSMAFQSSHGTDGQDLVL